MLVYPAILERDTNGLILATFPNFPEAATVGEDEGEALLRASDAIEIAIAERMARREEVPLPSPARGRPTVALSTRVAVKVLLYRAMRDKSVRKADLARRLHARQTTVDRLLDIRHASRLDQLDAALAVLGKRLDIRIRNAPSEPRGQS